MNRVVSFDGLTQKFFQPTHVWVSIAESGLTLLDSERDKGSTLLQGRHDQAFEGALRFGQVYELETFQKVLEEAFSYFRKNKSFLEKRIFTCTYAVPAASSPLQKAIFRRAFKTISWGKMKEVSRGEALLAWAHAKTKEPALAVLFMDESFSELVAGVGSTVRTAVYSDGVVTLIELLQQHLLKQEQVFFPRNQIEKMLKAFSFVEVMENKQQAKLSLRGQDQQSRTTVTLSLTGEAVLPVYEQFAKQLTRFFRQKIAKQLSSLSGIAVVSKTEVKGLADFLQQDFGWDWSLASHGGYEVVRGLQYLEKTTS